jgi:hypothetical protein
MAMTKKREKPEEPEFPHVVRSGSGSGGEGYYVQARYMYSEAVVICGQLFDKRWKRVSFEPSTAGVPVHRPYDVAKHLTELMDYAAANALRWWFVANATLTNNDICLETRLVACRIKYSYEATADMAIEAFAFRGRPVEDDDDEAPLPSAEA